MTLSTPDTLSGTDARLEVRPKHIAAHYLKTWALVCGPTFPVRGQFIMRGVSRMCNQCARDMAREAKREWQKLIVLIEPNALSFVLFPTSRTAKAKAEPCHFEHALPFVTDRLPRVLSDHVH